MLSVNNLKNKHPRIYKLVLIIVAVSFLALAGFLFYRSQYSLSAADEAKLYSEAEQLLSEDKVDQADEKYQKIVRKKFSKKDKSAVYLTQSTTCYQYNKLDCSLEALDKYENNTKADHNIYMTKASILYILDRPDEREEALKQALESLREQSNLSDEDQQLKDSLEKAFK